MNVKSVMFVCFMFCGIIEFGQSLRISINEINKVDSDAFRPFFRLFTGSLGKFLGNTGHNSYSFQYNLNHSMIQTQIPFSTRWVCDVNGPGRRSETVPDSVHRLRPGDIDVIGALGDSLTSANGAMAVTQAHVTIQNRGMSWSIGGQGNWRQFLTLPNILKEYNPKLYGYSISDSRSVDRNSRFNVAVPGAMSQDLPYMSGILLQRIQTDPKVDVKNQWKLITLMIGGNDFCADICFKDDPYEAVTLHEKNLLKALRTIREALPRTIVNVVNAVDVTMLMKQVGKKKHCIAYHLSECPCLFAKQFYQNYYLYVDVIKKWQEKEREIVNLPEFNGKDFTVNIYEFTKSLSPFYLEDGFTDFSYFSQDCFHVSQRGMAAAATSYWSSLFEPYNQKTKFWGKEFQNIRCPTEQHPFIRTRDN